MSLNLVRVVARVVSNPMPGTGYIIKTTSGDRGPYSTDQIRDFASQGKLAPAIHLRDASRGHSVTVAEVLDGRAKIKAMAVSTADIMIEDIPGAPAQAPAPKTGAVHRSERHSSVRRPQQDRSGSSRRSATDGSGSERAGRQGRAAKKTSVMLYVALVMVIIGAVVLVVVFKSQAAAPAQTGAPVAR